MAQAISRRGILCSSYTAQNYVKIFIFIRFNLRSISLAPRRLCCQVYCTSSSTQIVSWHYYEWSTNSKPTAWSAEVTRLSNRICTAAAHRYRSFSIGSFAWRRPDSDSNRMNRYVSRSCIWTLQSASKVSIFYIKLDFAYRELLHAALRWWRNRYAVFNLRVVFVYLSLA